VRECPHLAPPGFATSVRPTHASSPPSSARGGGRVPTTSDCASAVRRRLSALMRPNETTTTGGSKASRQAGVCLYVCIHSCNPGAPKRTRQGGWWTEAPPPPRCQGKVRIMPRFCSGGARSVIGLKGARRAGRPHSTWAGLGCAAVGRRREGDELLARYRMWEEKLRGRVVHSRGKEGGQESALVSRHHAHAHTRAMASWAAALTLVKKKKDLRIPET
jgi:hypothetical protein